MATALTHSLSRSANAWRAAAVDRWATTEAPDFELARGGVPACRQALDPDTLAALAL